MQQVRHWFGLAAGLILVAPVPPLNAQSVTEHVTAGAKARDRLDLPTAQAQFDSALALDSLDYAANWQAARVLIDLGAETPDDVKSPARDSLYARAEILARRAMAADPQGADGHFLVAYSVGRASLTKGTKERIRSAAEIRTEVLRAIELDPRHDGAYHALGRWNAEIMRLSGVQRFFAKSFLGAGIFNQASWNEAVCNLEKAVELAPEHIYHRLDLARVYVDRDRYADARKQLETIDTLPPVFPHDSAYKQAAVALLKSIANKK